MRAMSRPARSAGFLLHAIRIIKKYVICYASRFLAHDMHSRRPAKEYSEVCSFGCSVPNFHFKKE